MKKIFALLACVMLAASLCACTITKITSGDNGAAPASGQQGASNEEDTGEPEYEPKPGAIKSYAHTWVYTETAGGGRVFRLVLGEDGSAQLIVQDGVGNLVGLSSGTWTLTGVMRLRLALTAEKSDGRELGADEKFSIGGEYMAVLGDEADLIMDRTKGASALAPAMEEDAVIFYKEQFMPEDVSRACRAVLGYYAFVNGEPYPGRAEAEEYGSDGVVIRLRRDAGGSEADGVYTVDPVSLTGKDEATGAEIDFSYYSD